MKKVILFFMILNAFSIFSKETLTVYIPDSIDWISKYTKDFEKENNVEIQFVKFEGVSSIVSRMILEKRNPKADVVIGLSASNVSQAKKHNLLAKYVPKGAEKIKENYIDKDFYATLFDFGGLAIIYDSEKMLNPPKSFEELTKLKDVLIIQDPRTSSTGKDFLLWTIALYGDDWKDFWTRLSPAIKTITPGWSGSFAKLTTGEAPMMVSYASNEAYSYEYYGGTKYLTLIPEEGGYIQVEGSALVNKRRIKDVAKKFIDFTISENLQKEIPLNNWMLPAINVELPESFKYYKTSETYLSLDNEFVEKNTEKWIKEWEEIILR